MVDNASFFIRPHHVGENKQILDKEMKKVHLLGILKGGFKHTPVQLC